MSDDEDEEEVSTMLAFSSTSFNDLLQSFSSTSVTNLILGYGLMVSRGGMVERGVGEDVRG